MFPDPASGGLTPFFEVVYVQAPPRPYPAGPVSFLQR